ncbi:PAS domain-containing protein [Chromobacterium haemolyticum]|nr:PAS domain-containing protein [Chromobacterium haemolyticum]
MSDDGVLDDAERLLSDVLEAVPVGLALIDGQMRYRLLNQRLAEANGLPRSAHLGRRVAEMLPRIGEYLESLLRRVIESGEPVLDFCVNSKGGLGDGEVLREWQVSYLPYRESTGEVVGGGGRGSGMWRRSGVPSVCAARVRPACAWWWTLPWTGW